MARWKIGGSTGSRVDRSAGLEDGSIESERGTLGGGSLLRRGRAGLLSSLRSWQSLDIGDCTLQEALGSTLLLRRGRGGKRGALGGRRRLVTRLLTTLTLACAAASTAVVALAAATGLAVATRLIAAVIGLLGSVSGRRAGRIRRECRRDLRHRSGRIGVARRVLLLGTRLLWPGRGIRVCTVGARVFPGLPISVGTGVAHRCLATIIALVAVIVVAVAASIGLLIVRISVRVCIRGSRGARRGGWRS